MLRNTASVGSTNVLRFAKFGDERFAQRIRQIEPPAVADLCGYLRRDDVVEHRPDVLEPVDAVRDRVLRGVGAEVGRDEHPAAVRFVDDRSTHRPPSTGVDLHRRCARA